MTIYAHFITFKEFLIEDSESEKNDNTFVDSVAKVSVLSACSCVTYIIKPTR